MNDILKHRLAIQANIQKSFGVDVDDLEKGHNVGDAHPNGKWVWTEYKPGKFDWRGVKGGAKSGNAAAAAPSTPAPKKETPKATQEATPEKAEERMNMKTQDNKKTKVNYENPTTLVDISSDMQKYNTDKFKYRSIDNPEIKDVVGYSTTIEFDKKSNITEDEGMYFLKYVNNEGKRNFINQINSNLKDRTFLTSLVAEKANTRFSDLFNEDVDKTAMTLYIPSVLSFPINKNNLSERNDEITNKYDNVIAVTKDDKVISFSTSIYRSLYANNDFIIKTPLQSGENQITRLEKVFQEFDSEKCMKFSKKYYGRSSLSSISVNQALHDIIIENLQDTTLIAKEIKKWLLPSDYGITSKNIEVKKGSDYTYSIAFPMKKVGKIEIIAIPGGKRDFSKINLS